MSFWFKQPLVGEGALCMNKIFQKCQMPRVMAGVNLGVGGMGGLALLYLTDAYSAVTLPALHKGTVCKKW